MHARHGQALTGGPGSATAVDHTPRVQAVATRRAFRDLAHTVDRVRHLIRRADRGERTSVAW